MANDKNDPEEVKARIRKGAPDGDHDAVAEVTQLRGRAPEAVPLHTKLIPAANEGLERATERWRISRTDTANRLIQIGSFVADQMAEGNEILVRTPDGELQLVHVV